MSKAEYDLPDILGHIDLFARLDRITLARFAGDIEQVIVDPGDVICREGDPGDALYIVVEGDFDLTLRDDPTQPPQLLSHLKSPSSFGEMALLTGEPRSATVTAMTQGILLRLERSRFLDLVQREPLIAMTVAGTLSMRLRRSDQRLTRALHHFTHDHENSADMTIPGEIKFERATREPFTHDMADEHEIAPLTQRAKTATSTMRSPIVRGVLIVLTVALLLLAIVLAPTDQRGAFLSLLAAAVVMWSANLIPDFAVALGLVVFWVLLGLSTPAQAIAGFATSSWLFVFAMLGVAVSVGQSGLLFRTGLLLARKLPTGLGWQAFSLLVMGIGLIPLVPSSIGRVLLITPLAQAAAQASRVPDRSSASALLGMSAWIGAHAVSWIIPTGTPLAVFAAGLLPEATRQRFTFGPWLVAAAPLAILIASGTFVAAWLVLRPRLRTPAGRELVGVQLRVLGPITGREIMMIVILVGLVVGWNVAPSLGIDGSVVALTGLVLATGTGNFTRESIREIDWDLLLTYGVVVSLSDLISRYGVDTLASDLVVSQVGGLGLGPLGFILAITIVNSIIRLVVPQTQATLLMVLATVPGAVALGIDPWVIAIAILATSGMWIIPAQTPAYLMAFATSDGRLFTHGQARQVGLAAALIVLLALCAIFPYWRALGLA